MVWRTLLVVPALFAAMQAHATSPMSRVPIEVRQTYAGGDTTTLVCEGQPAGLGQDCTFEIAEKGHPPRRYPLRMSASGYYALATDYAYTELGDGAFWVAIEVDCKGRDLALVPGGTEADTRCALHFERDGDAVRPTSVEIRRLEGDDYRVEQRILDQRDEEAGIDIESFNRSDEVIDRCNKLARDAAKPYASNPLNLGELRRAAERMRDDRSPLFQVLQAPPEKVEAALRGEPGMQLTVSVAIRDNAVRIFGDEACGVMIDEFLVPMLFPAKALFPDSEIEALRKQQGVNFGNVDSWLFLLLVREAGKLQAEAKGER
jgi:hypothetical protein